MKFNPVSMDDMPRMKTATTVTETPVSVDTLNGT